MVASSIRQSSQAMTPTQPTTANPEVIIWDTEEESATRAKEVSATVRVKTSPCSSRLKARIRECRRRPVRVPRMSKTMFSPYFAR